MESQTVLNWDEYFFKIAETVSLKSKDPNTKLGCVIVGKNNEIKSTGYNSFVRNLNDNVVERQERPEKYFWIEHAERNAIYNAARNGTSLDGCKMYVTLMPCMDCARAIVQCGIKEIIVPKLNNDHNEKWNEHFKRTIELFNETGINLRVFNV